MVSTPLNAQHSLQGLVYDEYDHPLPAVRILLSPDSLYTLSDSAGRFVFPGLRPGRYALSASMAGYQPDSMEVQLPLRRPRALHFHLEPMTLAAVQITEAHAKQEATLSTSHLGAEALARDLRGTFVNSLGQLPGLDAINIGVGIAKPVIRGLSANRVVVNDLGVKQEGQQWGMDHGLELDPFGVERVEIVKGPASLQYGSDALGGAINLMPAPPPPAHHLLGEVQGLYKSNNQHVAGSAMLAVNGNDRWLQARYSAQDFGDYRVPADSFVYQTFVLPIYDGYLKNTSGREQSLHLGVGQRRAWGLSRLTFRQYRLEAGIFPGAIGAPRAYALTRDGNRRDRDLPYQAVRHTKVIYNQLVFLGRQYLNLNLGYQRNQRQEHGYPEYHFQPYI
ncbi:MAG: TonB-dependent receptor, partial [Bacteroidetes bacterium]